MGFSGEKMKFSRWAAAFLAGGWITTPAAAQVPTSTSDIVPSTSGPSRSEVALSDQVFRDLVSCVIRYQPARTRNLLGTIPGTRQESTILYSFDSRMETCYDAFRTGGRAMTYQGNVLRGVVAETYFARDFPAGISPATNVGPEAAAAWARPRPADGAIPQMEMLHAMARCATIRQPATVSAMLRAAPFSPEERAALRALQADLSACLDAGVEFTASRQALRGLLAEAALHYGEAQRNGFAAAQAQGARAD